MKKLQTVIRKYDRVAVAVSGGPDSAIILREAAAALGANRVLAVTAETGCMPRRRLFVAKRVAELAGVEHIVGSIESLSEEELRHNGPERCAQCRSRVLRYALDEAWVHGCDAVLDGRHAGQDGPAAEAARELPLVSPLLQCKMGEAQLKLLRGDLPPTLPQDKCLYSRVPAGRPIPTELVSRIDSAEEALRSAGYACVQLHYSEEYGFQLVSHDKDFDRIQSGYDAIAPLLQEYGIVESVIPTRASAFFGAGDSMSPI